MNNVNAETPVTVSARHETHRRSDVSTGGVRPVTRTVSQTGEFPSPLEFRWTGRFAGEMQVAARRHLLKMPPSELRATVRETAYLMCQPLQRRKRSAI